MNRKLISATLVGMLLLSLGAGGVAAQETNCNPLVDDCDVDWGALVSGWIDSAQYSASSVFGVDEANASDTASNISQEINENSSAYVDYYNSHISQNVVENDTHIIRLTFVDSEGNYAPVYAVAEFNATEMTSLTVKDNVSGTVDDSCMISGYAYSQSEEEISNFEESYVLEDKVPSNSYMTKKYGQYGGDIDCSFPIANMK